MKPLSPNYKQNCWFFSPTMTWHVVEIVVSTLSTTVMCLESVSWLLLIN